MLDALFLRLRRGPFFYRLAWFNRILLAAAFIPTGSVKFMGQRFTLMGPETPIGAFFEAMFQTGLFWRFIGLSQIVAGVLLLIPRFSHLGAAIFFPIILNIVVITVGLDFGGTPVVTASMLLSVTYLCVWDWHRFRALFTLSPPLMAVPRPRLDRWERTGFQAFALCLLGFFFVTRGQLDSGFMLLSLVGGFLAGLLTLSRYLWLWKKDRLPQAKPAA